MSDPSSDQNEQGEKLSDYVYRQVLHWLLQGRLHPGQMVNRRWIADELGVSVAPVLEAMLALERDGLFETIRRRGTQVRYFRPEDIRGQFALRIAVEAQAARMYCGDPVRRHQTRLLELAERVDRSTPQSVDSWRSEIFFHRSLVELAALPALLETFDRVMKCSFFVAVSLLSPVSGQQHDHHGHRRLVAQLAEANADAADGIIRNHLITHRAQQVLDEGAQPGASRDTASAPPIRDTGGTQEDPFLRFLASAK